MNTLYNISTNHPDPIHTLPAWGEKAVGKIMCPICKSIKRSWYPKPIDIVLQDNPDHRLCGGVCWIGVKIFHKDFINQILPYLNAFVCGKTLGPDGKVIDEYVTCYTNKRIVVRGGKGSEYNTCDECGTWSKGFVEPQYVLRDYLTDARIYQDRHSSLIIDEKLANELDFSPWPDADLEPIAIVDEPLDKQHLPFDPPEIIRKYPEAKWIKITKESVEKGKQDFRQFLISKLQEQAEKYPEYKERFENHMQKLKN